MCLIFQRVNKVKKGFICVYKSIHKPCLIHCVPHLNVVYPRVCSLWGDGCLTMRLSFRDICWHWADAVISLPNLLIPCPAMNPTACSDTFVHGKEKKKIFIMLIRGATGFLQKDCFLVVLDFTAVLHVMVTPIKNKSMNRHS